MPAAYDYLSLELPPGRPAWEALRREVRESLVPAVNAGGGAVLGLFFPQIGFASNEATLLARWPTASEATPPALKTAVLRSRDRLAATLRPGDADLPRPGGIYVHRWFNVAAKDVEAFIDLSGQAWPSFEAGFDSNIFGLFRALTPALNGDIRMLLLTRYADHGVWEASRQPAATARDAFASRHALTTSTIARSSTLLPLA